VAVELPVFNGDHRVHEVLRYFTERHPRALLDGKLVDERAVLPITLLESGGSMFSSWSSVGRVWYIR